MITPAAAGLLKGIDWRPPPSAILLCTAPPLIRLARTASGHHASCANWVWFADLALRQISPTVVPCCLPLMKAIWSSHPGIRGPASHWY
jgi:hypothetical protein